MIFCKLDLDANYGFAPFQLDAKNKARQAKIDSGEGTVELSEFEIKKLEKEKRVAELRERLEKLKAKVRQVDK